MSRPGTQIILRETPPPRSAPTNTGVWFVAGISYKGPVEPVLTTSLEDFVNVFGDRISNSVLYDSLDLFFHEGGNQAYIARVVGPGAAAASFNLEDEATDETLQVSAASPGEWGNSLNVAVEAGEDVDTFKIIISHDDLGVVEESTSFSTKEEAIAWSQFSEWVRLTDLAGTGIPDVRAEVSLAGGDDDLTNVTEDSWNDAINLFSKSFGPGQVSMPGRTTSEAQQNIQDHCYAHNRVAILDAPDASDSASVIAAAEAARGTSSQFAAMFWPWLTIPGIIVGTVRSVPPCGLVAGGLARNDASGQSPNQPFAGDNGQSITSIGLSQPALPDATRETVNAAGVCVIREILGGIRVYGWRSLNVANPNWVDFGNARLYMAISARGDDISERYVFKQLDGRGLTISHYGAELSAMLVSYFNDGSLFGAEPAEAFRVDVGPAVNPVSQLAQGILRAVISLRMSPFAELVKLEIVKVAITQPVAS